MNFIYKAKAINGNIEVKGYYALASDGKHLIFALGKDDLLNAITYKWWEEIDPSTLTISFDDGKSWKSTEEVQDLINIVERGYLGG